jgi:hypothetical protein
MLKTNLLVDRMRMSGEWNSLLEVMREMTQTKLGKRNRER